MRRDASKKSQEKIGKRPTPREEPAVFRYVQGQAARLRLGMTSERLPGADMSTSVR